VTQLRRWGVTFLRRESRRQAVRLVALGLLVGAVSSGPASRVAAATAAPLSRWSLDPPVASVRDAVRARDAGDAQLPWHSGTGRRVVYSISLQRVWAVGGNSRVQRTYLVSGRRSQPGPGTYRVFSRSQWTSSSVSAESMRYMVRFTHGRRTGAPIGFHSIPRDGHGRAAQSLDQLGQPLSHGCVRQGLADARFLWGFAPVGTQVVVTG
jgi:lipoprotein-anchoring transpeptidase ErfK/SrfK